MCWSVHPSSLALLHSSDIRRMFKAFYNRMIDLKLHVRPWRKDAVIRHHNLGRPVTFKPYSIWPPQPKDIGEPRPSVPAGDGASSSGSSTKSARTHCQSIDRPTPRLTRRSSGTVNQHALGLEPGVAGDVLRFGVEVDLGLRRAVEPAVGPADFDMTAD
jgi:hypothetical protein